MARPFNIGFVGLGFGARVAQALASGAAREWFTVAAGCDPDDVRREEFCRQHGVKGYASLDALLADPDIPVIGLFSGPGGRAGLLSRIVRAGKDVMTTKPFELDPVAARQVLAEARERGRTIYLNSPPPRPPEYLQQIRRWQEEFALGRPVSCRAEMQVSYREQADGRWFDDPALCPLAPVFRIGIYSLNDLIQLFGEVSTVQVLSSRLFTGRPTPDNAQLGLRFASGVLGSVHASFCVDNGQHYANALTLNFERGTIFRNVFPVDYGEAENSSRLSLVATRPGGEMLRREWNSPEVSGSYPWEAFHDALTGCARLEMPADEIVRAVEVIAAMIRAERSGASEQVRLNPSPGSL